MLIASSVASSGRRQCLSRARTYGLPARHLLQADPGCLDRRNPAFVIRFHQSGQLCRRQFRSVQAKFIEPALHRLRPDGFEEDAIQLQHDFARRARWRLMMCSNTPQLLSAVCSNTAHGEQERSQFHGYYDHHCYLPLYVFCGRARHTCGRARGIAFFPTTPRSREWACSAGKILMIRPFGK